jgi:glycosyltransferase involved in cell wall biosynthesis
MSEPAVDVIEQPRVEHPRGRVIAVMPAYNAARTLQQTVSDIPPGAVDEILLVDDASKDNTVAMARDLGLTVIEHPKNLGYGGNQKTCYRYALDSGAEFIVMIHPDYQYDSRVIPTAVEILRLGICDVVLGSRIRTRGEALKGGMPWWKYLANRILTTIENVSLGQNLGDFHSGFRAYRREVLETIPFETNTDDFAFDSQFLVQSVYFGFKLGDIPVPVRYFDEASSINWWRCIKYGLHTLWAVKQFWLQRLRLGRFRMFRRKRPQATGDRP